MTNHHPVSGDEPECQLSSRLIGRIENTFGNYRPSKADLVSKANWSRRPKASRSGQASWRLALVDARSPLLWSSLARLLFSRSPNIATYTCTRCTFSNAGE